MLQMSWNSCVHESVYSYQDVKLQILTEYPALIDIRYQSDL